MFVAPPDLLRLLAVPCLAWAGYHDVRTRRVPDWIWLPLAAGGVVAIVVDWLSVVAASVRSALLLRCVVSLGLVAALGYLLWRLDAMGGADAKAIGTLALVFPVCPTVYFRWGVLPLERASHGVFSLTILTNTVLIGMVIPVAIAVYNGANGRITPAMFIGRPYPITAVPDVYGQLLRNDSGPTLTGGLDLDALRMYLRWRGTSLATLRASPDAHRDPASIPTVPNDPGDGSLAEHNEPFSGILPDGTDPPRTDRVGTDANPSIRGGEHEFDDQWGAAAFLADIEGDAYGTTPGQLRAGLELLSSNETESVWISPGVPFLVVVLLGLVTALTHGDVLVTATRALGLA